LKYKTNVGCCLLGHCPIFNDGISNIDIFKLIQSWNIDIESLLGSGRWFNVRILTLIQHQNADQR